MNQSNKLRQAAELRTLGPIGAQAAELIDAQRVIIAGLEQRALRAERGERDQAREIERLNRELRVARTFERVSA